MSVLRKSLSRSRLILSRVAPGAARWISGNFGEAMFLAADLDATVERLARAADRREQVDIVCTSPRFKALQVPRELERFARLISEAGCRQILEIGGASGGTLLLFHAIAAPGTDIASVDLAYTSRRVRTFASRLTSGRITVSCYRGDSHGDDAKRWARERFPDGIDLLFIDGDHSLAGVRSDFEAYAPMVRPGGIIAFHDIVPDGGGTNDPQRAGHWAGGVPAFWATLREKYRVEEFVDNDAQRGYGIGVVHWPSGAAN